MLDGLAASAACASRIFPIGSPVAAASSSSVLPPVSCAASIALIFPRMARVTWS